MKRPGFQFPKYDPNTIRNVFLEGDCAMPNSMRLAMWKIRYGFYLIKKAEDDG